MNRLLYIRVGNDVGIISRGGFGYYVSLGHHSSTCREIRILLTKSVSDVSLQQYLVNHGFKDADFCSTCTFPEFKTEELLLKFVHLVNKYFIKDSNFVDLSFLKRY